jgi:hypothetical protein
MTDAAAPTPSPEPAVLIYVRDLLFSSKITATARAEGVTFRVVRDKSKLLTTAAPRLLVDLNSAENLDAAAEWKKAFGGHVTGFSGHVNVDILQAAKAAGIDQVMTNGQFSASLPAILKQTV